MFNIKLLIWKYVSCTIICLCLLYCCYKFHYTKWFFKYAHSIFMLKLCIYSNFDFFKIFKCNYRRYFLVTNLYFSQHLRSILYSCSDTNLIFLNENIYVSCIKAKCESGNFSENVDICNRNLNENFRSYLLYFKN